MPGTKQFQLVTKTPEPGKWEVRHFLHVGLLEVKPLTQDMNKADAVQIVQLLGQCDAEIFQEGGQVIAHIPLVLSGGGTSGRMAFLMSVSFNQLMKGLGQKPTSLLVVTVGLYLESSWCPPLLGGCWEEEGDCHWRFGGTLLPLWQARWTTAWITQMSFLPVLVGFNPLSMDDHKREGRVNIASFTKSQNKKVNKGCFQLRKLLVGWLPGEKCRVYLVGWQTLGIIAITDGVECTHAFDFQYVHGFLTADRSGMFNQEAELINQGPHFSFSQEDFLTPILPSLTETDTVLFIFTLDDNLTEVQTLVEQVKEKTSNIQHPGLGTQHCGAVPVSEGPALRRGPRGAVTARSSWRCYSCFSLSLQILLKKLFPSIISITWPLLFFEYQGNFIQGGGGAGEMWSHPLFKPLPPGSFPT
ncbi:unnamed protein product [Rangifer tarandus platyrhynchus]|uniref:Uncharacterized protein n=3 Tax=Rangifer tarandus platyrhynchus TaxID=3082113 RepID=A0AC59ZU25_RANTA